MLEFVKASEIVENFPNKLFCVHQNSWAAGPRRLEILGNILSLCCLLKRFRNYFYCKICIFRKENDYHQAMECSMPNARTEH